MTNTNSFTKTTKRCEPTGEQLAELVTIVNKIRMAKSWDVLPAGKADAYARTWADTLNIANVPPKPSIYRRLYEMAIERRIYCRETGLDVPEIEADFLASLWKILKEKMRDAEIAAGRTLPQNAESVCKHCGGSGFRTIKEGKYSFAKKCDHLD